MAGCRAVAAAAGHGSIAQSSWRHMDCHYRLRSPMSPGRRNRGLHRNHDRRMQITVQNVPVVNALRMGWLLASLCAVAADVEARLAPAALLPLLLAELCGVDLGVLLDHGLAQGIRLAAEPIRLLRGVRAADGHDNLHAAIVNGRSRGLLAHSRKDAQKEHANNNPP
jgi:hypothetical protein